MSYLCLPNLQIQQRIYSDSQWTLCFQGLEESELREDLRQVRLAMEKVDTSINGYCDIEKFSEVEFQDYATDMMINVIQFSQRMAELGEVPDSDPLRQKSEI